MGFAHEQILPGVFHIRDTLGVHMTLLTGSEKALLVDTGYGLEDTAAYVRSLTRLPLTVFLTHGHFDHALGSRWFDRVLLLPEEREVYREYTSRAWRVHVLEGAEGLCADEEGYLRSPMPPCGDAAPGEYDLGSLTAVILACPGHTPGSAMVFMPERRLLLTGDDWNPCTWLFFPEALPPMAYRANMEKLLKLPFDHVLCPHREELYPGKLFRDFVTGLTPEALREARPSDAGKSMGIPTAQALLPEGQSLVFSLEKYGKEAGIQ